MKFDTQMFDPSFFVVLVALIVLAIVCDRLEKRKNPKW